VPPRHQGRLIRPLGREAHRTWNADTCAGDLPEIAAGTRDQFEKSSGHVAQYLVRTAVDLQLGRGLHEHLAAPVDEREMGVRGPEIDSQHQLARIIERDDPGRPAGRSGDLTGLPQVSGVDQLRHPQGDGRPRETGDILELATRTYLTRANQFQDAAR
jgi:hypothetical protein